MATLIVQPSSKDNYIFSAYPDTNYGTEIFTGTEGSTTTVNRSLLEFLLTGLPAGASISAATLALYYYSAPYIDPVGRTLNAYRLTRTDWVEAQSTWNSYKTASAWTAPGGDYTADDGASVAVPAGFGWVTWDITAQVQYAQTNSVPVELLIRDSGEAEVQRFVPLFYTRNYAVDASKCPKLTITYTPRPLISNMAGAMMAAGCI